MADIPIIGEKKPAPKPILCIDFDGVLHSYDTPWAGASVVTDPPVDGAMQFLDEARHHFRLAIYSSRSKDPEGVAAMQAWLRTWLLEYLIEKRERKGGILLPDSVIRDGIMDDLSFPVEKPAAFLTVDDRCFLFQGIFPEPETLLSFKPWNKR